METEWLDFGHKFADRCGHGENSEDQNERCPVFLQWLDSVHQLQRQFPCSFEFNEAFLVRCKVFLDTETRHSRMFLICRGWNGMLRNHMSSHWLSGCDTLKCCLGVLATRTGKLLSSLLLLSYLRFLFKPLHASLCVCVYAGEAGAAHLLLSVRHLPVQQWQGEGGPPRPGEDLLSVVTCWDRPTARWGTCCTHRTLRPYVCCYSSITERRFFFVKQSWQKPRKTKDKCRKGVSGIK